MIHGATRFRSRSYNDLQVELEVPWVDRDAKRKVQQLDGGRVRASKTCIQKKQQLHDQQTFVNIRADARRQARVAALQTKEETDQERN